jgi:TPR repeat protein
MQQLYQTQVRSFLRHQLPNYSKEMALGIYLLGRFHEDGGRQQFAYPCFERAAEFGVARAHYDLALYAEQGVQRPLEQVFEGALIPGQTIRLTDTPEELFAHYKLAYEGGVQEACYGLGRCYLKETGTALNRIEGLRLMRRAAENGDQRAWESLGDLYGAEGSIREAAASTSALK